MIAEIVKSCQDRFTSQDKTRKKKASSKRENDRFGMSLLSPKKLKQVLKLSESTKKQKIINEITGNSNLLAGIL